MSKNRVLFVGLAGMLLAVVALLISTDVDEGGEEVLDRDESVAPVAEKATEVLERPESEREQAKNEPDPREQLVGNSIRSRGRRAFELFPGASISGSVIDGANVGVAAVGVRLLRNSEERRTTSDDDGGFSFTHLAPGIYRLYVDPTSLREGFLPPWRQHVPRAYSGVATGLNGTSLRVTGAAELDADLRVFRSSSVSGRVIEMDGDEVAGALVILSSEDGRKFAARTGEDGSFSIARVYPGLYSAIVDLGPEYPDSNASAPIPFQVAVSPGSQQFLRDILVGEGGYILTGRVVDQHDAPMPGMIVRFLEGESSHTTSHTTSTTGPDGYFRVGRFLSTELRVIVDETDERKMRGDGRLNEPVEVERVLVSGSSDELELGELRVERQHPFLVVGQIQVDPDWAESNEWTDWSAKVLVRDRTGRRMIAEVYPSMDWLIESDEGLGEPIERMSASFEWGCATPADLVQLVALISDGHGGEREKVLTVEPKLDETFELLFEFP